MGVTVEPQKAKLRYKLNAKYKEVHIIDLPGTYSIDGYTRDENLAIDYIKSNQVDGIVNIIDISQLERSLVFTLDLIHLGKPIVVVLNKKDIAIKQNIGIDLHKLEKLLNEKVICTQASKKRGLNELIDIILDKVGVSNEQQTN
ncbi:MAG: 50S ribosome-binding GTPase [Tenericutes bacterium]|nr:50S ribosome-binding GTPase [Mycoplasmatota bacterium]